MHVQAIRADDVDQVEGVPPLRGYRLVYLYELALVRRFVPRTLAADLDAAAAARVERDPQAFAFKFWPAPSQAGQLAAALATVRS